MNVNTESRYDMPAPPSHVDIEKQVLGGALIQKRLLVECIDKLAPEHFYNDQHKVIYSTMLSMFNQGKTVDLCTVGAERVVDVAYLASLTCDNMTGMYKIGSYCNMITRAYKRRKLIEYGHGLIADCYATNDVDEITADFGKKYFGVLADETDSAESVGDIVGRVEEEIRARTSESRVGLSTGIADLDDLITLSPSDLIILAARPAMGKTALAMNITESVAKQGKKTVFFSLEMSKEQLVKRLISQVGCIDNTIINRGVISNENSDKLTFAADRIRALDIKIDDTPALHISKIRARAMMEHAKGDLGLIVVDYLQLGSGDGQQREREISSISSGLKALAKELSVPVIALSQLNRSLEQRPDKRPILSDLRESGAIEQDADIIIFAYRDEIYHDAEDNPNRGTAEIIVGKNRHGATGKAIASFTGKYTKFDGLSYRSEF